MAWVPSRRIGAGFGLVAIAAFTNLMLAANVYFRSSSILEEITPSRQFPRTLILYAYHETPDAHRNAEFFIKHGLHSAADFIFIQNGEGDLANMLPQHAPNVKLCERQNACYDMGSYAAVLLAHDGALIKQYSRFILLNASIRGPFIPPLYSSECWSNLYLSKITNDTKLSGMTFNCFPNPHPQSMLLAMDSIGLNIILNGESGLNSCPTDIHAAVDIEISTAKLIWKAGFQINVAMTAYHSGLYPDPKACQHGDLLYEGAYHGINLHPYETMFVKTKRGYGSRELDLLTQWHDALPYSSFSACKVVT
ncbi:hypothetical protein HDU88_002320 [Geranomyces variabilis]|nr:hypothetical protein HDU88_002320 [Geranomyces variabilis]